jgi:hypothetical protein
MHHSGGQVQHITGVDLDRRLAFARHAQRSGDQRQHVIRHLRMAMQPADRPRLGEVAQHPERRLVEYHH